MVHPYSSIDTTAAGKKFRVNLLDRSDFDMINSLLIAVHAFTIDRTFSRWVVVAKICELVH